MILLPENIKQLIQCKREGAWWDFKLKHHSTNSDLIHDVLCMSNSLVKADKYIIFGVSDSGGTVGVGGDEKKEQADIVGIFQDLIFSGRTPSLSLVYYDYENVEVGVLTIKDEPYKPFFLNVKYEKKPGRLIPAGVVYTRAECRNTPLDRTAKDYDIERMWSERFGIDDKKQVIFEHEAYANVHYMVSVSFLSFHNLNFTFRHKVSGAILSIFVDVEALYKENPILLQVGSELIRFSYEEVCSLSKYSNFIYHYVSDRAGRGDIHLERITGAPK